jgi:hypothetical protein
MGWFGISNTVNRCNNACRMKDDAQLVQTLKEKTIQLSVELDAQLKHAERLAFVANFAPPTQILCSRGGELSATAAELAADLKVARKDAQRCRNAVSTLVNEIEDDAEQLKTCVQQYDLPRVQRRLRLDEIDQPPTGKQIAGFTREIAQQSLYRIRHFEATHAYRAVRTHNVIAKAEMIVLNQLSDSNSVVNALRQLTSP